MCWQTYMGNLAVTSQKRQIEILKMRKVRELVNLGPAQKLLRGALVWICSILAMMLPQRHYRRRLNLETAVDRSICAL